MMVMHQLGHSGDRHRVRAERGPMTGSAFISNLEIPGSMLAHRPGMTETTS